MKKRILINIGILSLLVAVLFIAACEKQSGITRQIVGESGDSGSSNIDSGTSSIEDLDDEGTETTGTGKITFLITDKQEELDIKSLTIKIDDIRVHRTGSGDGEDDNEDDDDKNETEIEDDDQNETEDDLDDINETDDDNETDDYNKENKTENDKGGWIEVCNGDFVFDLIAIKDVNEFLCSNSLKAGKYTQIRLHIEDVIGNINNKTVQLEVPSDDLKLIHPFEIKDGEEIKLILDFDVDKSVIKPGDKYLLKPVIKIIAENVNQTNNCGNGNLDSGESCDGSNLNNKTCTDFNFNNGTLSCNNCNIVNTNCFNSNQTVSVCGNNIIENNEQCEGSDFNSVSCSTYGFNNGTLSCNNCTRATSGCFNSNNSTGNNTG